MLTSMLGTRTKPLSMAVVRTEGRTYEYERTTNERTKESDEAKHFYYLCKSWCKSKINSERKAQVHLLFNIALYKTPSRNHPTDQEDREDFPRDFWGHLVIEFS